MTAECDKKNENEEMRVAILKFFTVFESAVVKLSEFSLGEADKIYKSTFDLGRHMNLSKQDFGSFVGDEQKKLFRDSFPDIFVRLVGWLPGYVNNYEPWQVVQVKKKLSELAFVRCELFELYANFCGGDENRLQSEPLEKSIKSLDDTIETIEEDIDIWLRPDFPEIVEEEPIYLPDLNGVPLSHKWWTSKQREQSKQIFHSSKLSNSDSTTTS